MAVISKDELLQAISNRIGDDTSDEALALLEDVSDTLTDFDARLNDDTDWKQRYEENDKQWREKYRDRFKEGSSNDDNDNRNNFSDKDDKDSKIKSYKYEDLFEEKE